jgi:hypothetical protein
MAMRPIERRRFEAFAGYTRNPNLAFLIEELAWYEEGGEILLGLVSLDRTDRDYVAHVLGRDAKRRFRAVGLRSGFETQAEATIWLRDELAKLVQKPPSFHHQGDEEGEPVDFFKPIVTEEKRSYAFEQLRAHISYSPALGLIRELMHYYEDPDGNFIEQFQSTGFDARIWEVYLYAAFTEMGYGFDRSRPVPDFHCEGPPGNLFVEATTLGVSPKTPARTAENIQSYLEDYVPIRFSSTLGAKLEKRYWELPHVAGVPFTIAIQDFHAPGSMTWTAQALCEYLYGLRQRERDGEVVSERIDTHRWDKKEIPSNFFRQPGAENVSAVIANPAGTLPKFKRMGYLIGFGERALRMRRQGIAFLEGQSEPSRFDVDVTAEGYSETWCEGLAIYHNPDAKIPLPIEAFPGAGHFTVENGWLMSKLPPFFPIGSQTLTLSPKRATPEASNDRSSGASIVRP